MKKINDVNNIHINIIHTIKYESFLDNDFNA